MAFSAAFDALSFTSAMASHAASHHGHGTQEDDVLLVKLKEAINQDNPAAVMCIKTVVRDSSEEQWERLYNQLESRHQVYIQLKTEQHSDELNQLQGLVRRNLATERRLLDEQLANHRSVLSTGDGCSLSSGADGHALHDETATTWKAGSGAAAGISASSLVDRLSTERQQQHPHHSADTNNEEATAAALRATLAQRDHELALTQERLARSRRQCDTLLGRLTAAEAELQFLRNQRLSRGGGGQQRRSTSLSEAADIEAGDDSAAASLRRSLAELEQRHLIADTAADALELSGQPDELEQRYDCLQVERREVEAALTRVPGPGSLHHSWHSARDRELLEKKLDNIDRELVRLRNSLKQFQLI